MSWTERYKKQNCTAAKDVNFGNIDSIAKVKVPAMVISSFQKKVGAAKAPFDVFVEVDNGAGKGRIVVKKVPPSDITIEWADRSGAGAETGKNVMKVKAELTSLGITNNGYLQEILGAKERIKALKEDIKKLEGEAPQMEKAAVAKSAEEMRKALTEAGAAGKEIFGKHNNWYLMGPRKGIAPILKQFGLDPKELNAGDADEFNKALHGMSANANQVKQVFDVDIKNAIEALIARVNNLEATFTKSQFGALIEVRKNLLVELQKVRELVGKGLAEMKLEKTESLMTDLGKPASSAYKRLKAGPQFIQSEMESNNTRLALIPKFLEAVPKQVSRLKKGIPPEHANDGQIQKAFSQLDGFVEENTKHLNEAKGKLEACNHALTEFAKG
jgi:DNA repair exonuclease SbcCD ATPase subunit